MITNILCIDVKFRIRTKNRMLGKKIMQIIYDSG